jgi:hypothetical protein
VSVPVDRGGATAGQNVEPLVTAAVPVCWAAFGIAWLDPHLGCLRSTVAVGDPKSIAESQVLCLHLRVFPAADLAGLNPTTCTLDAAGRHFSILRRIGIAGALNGNGLKFQELRQEKRDEEHVRQPGARFGRQGI